MGPAGTALWEVAQAIGGSEALGDILAVLANLMPRVTSLARCTIFLIDWEKREYRNVAGTGLEAEEVAAASEPRPLAAELTPLQLSVLHGGRAVAVTDVETDARLTEDERGRLRKMGACSLLIVPLRVSQRVLGFLTLDSPGQTHHFAEEETQLAEIVAAQAALAIDRAESMKRARDSTQALADLNAQLEQRAAERSHQLLAAGEQRAADLLALVEAGIAITSELSLDRALQRIVDLARGVLHARYAALGVIGDDPATLERFVTAGMDEETQRRIGHLPTGRGILGVLLKEARPLRLADLTRDPHSVGFPAHHPPMHSFLGVPIVSRGQVLGRLYLTEKESAPEFSAEDESLAMSLAAQAAVAIENARLFAEVQEQQERLIRAERLYAIGQLAATVGHELRNPLATLSTAAYYLRTKVSGDERVERNLELINREVRTATRIIEDLLDFSRVRQPQRMPADLLPLVQDALQGVEIPDGIQVDVVISPDLPRVCADPIQIQQVLRNLAQNGVQAMPQGGTLRIEGAPCASAVHVRVSDTGVGIAPDAMARIFEPLFTTKPRGVGLGLALVRRVIETHQGSIEVESEVGKGTTFTLCLPAASVAEP